MHPMMNITSIEYVFHIALFIIAIVTPIIMFLTANQFIDKTFRRICFLFAFAFLFGALRWAGGSMARLHLDITDTLAFNFAWLLAGVFSAIFGIWGAWELYKVAKQIGFK